MRTEIVGGRGNAIYASWGQDAAINLIFNKKSGIIKEKEKKVLQMRQIGRYEGRPCFECSMREFIEGRCYNDSDRCYIINNQFILRNKIIGVYVNGTVSRYDGPFNTFYMLNDFDYKDEVREEKKLTRSVPKTPTLTTETASVDALDFNSLINQINFTDYTTEVDNFFVNL